MGVAEDQAQAERWVDRLIDAGVAADLVAMDRTAWQSSPTMTQRFGVLLPETPFLYLVSAQQLGLLRDEFPSGSLVEASRE